MEKREYSNRKHPLIYEINTRIWLRELSIKHGKSITLSNIPDSEWQYLSCLGFDFIWLMGVWERSPKSIEIARNHQGLQKEYTHALPEWKETDIIGSPYSIASYSINHNLGTRQDLIKVKRQLQWFGLRLILDFVPNHVALDHPWIQSHPEYFIQIEKDSAAGREDLFFEVNSEGRNFFIAHARDPYFFKEYGAWTDTAQLNYFNPETRAAMIQTLHGIAKVCDGVRCDMSMLVINKNFQDAWQEFSGQWGTLEGIEEFWSVAITSIKQYSPSFIFIAEDYWGRESERYHQQLGFDYTYNETLFKLMDETNLDGLKQHLCLDNEDNKDYWRHTVNYVENHDKERATIHFGKKKARAAAVVSFTLMGLRLFHQGQLSEKYMRIPLQLNHNQEGTLDCECSDFYNDLLKSLRDPVFHEGSWHWIDSMMCSDTEKRNPYILSWYWSNQNRIWLIVVNFSEISTEAILVPPFLAETKDYFVLNDQLNHQVYPQSRAELSSKGLYVKLDSYNYHLFRLE